MKKFFLFAATALMIGAFASCTPEEETKDDDNKNEEEQKQEPEKSKAAKLLTFSLSDGTVTLEGEIFDSQKIVEVQYNPEDAAVITNATATVTISEKATISPDPATIKDWSSEQKLTVTAEDGQSKNEYTVKTIPMEYAVSIAPADGDGKKLVEIGAANDIAFFAGNQIAFCDVDKIVTSDGRVYNLDLTFVGNLNRGEIPSGCAFTSMGNDDNGVLIAAVGYGDAEYTIPGADGDGVLTWNYTNATRFYAWKDGYDQAPTKIYENASFLSWMNVSGDVNGKMLITAKQSGNVGNHHLFHFDNGVVSGAKWAWYNTGKEEVDRSASDVMNFTPACWRLGQTAGSTVSPLGVEKEDALFIHGQAMSALSVEDPEYSTDKWGKDGNAGMFVGVRQGYNNTENLYLRGTAETINGGTARYGGLYGWGNVCTTGNIKAFRYNGNVYAAISGSDWNEPHITVVDVTASTADKTEYLLSTQGVAKSLVNPITSVAYVYNPATDKGEIAVFYENSGANENESFIRRFTISREKK